MTFLAFRALCYFGQDFFLLGEIFVICFFKEKKVAGVVFQGGSSVILRTNKTVDKKSSHNPYMQDYARFFVQFLIGS